MPALESLFNKVEEETPTQVFSCEYCETFKNSFVFRTPPVAAFLSLIKKLFSIGQCGMVSFKKVCRSPESMFFTCY